MLTVAVYSLSVLLGLIFLRKGVFSAAVFLLNISMGVYLGLSLCPVILKLFPENMHTDFIVPTVIAGIALIYFITSQILCLSYLMANNFEPEFPKIVDIAGGGFSGFCAGFIIFSFLSFIFSGLPFASNDSLQQIITIEELKRTSGLNIQKTCAVVNSLSMQGKNQSHERIISEYINQDLDAIENPDAAEDSDSQEKRDFVSKRKFIKKSGRSSFVKKKSD